MRTPRRNDQHTGALEALHHGTEREDIDSPSQFELHRTRTTVDTLPVPGRTAVHQVPKSLPDRAAAQPVPVPHRSMVRPYARTGGRTQPDYELAIEAMVSTSEQGRRYQGAVSAEHRAICDLCVQTTSVAEIAAHLGLPLGVVKVLVGDMDNAGLVVIHQHGLMMGDRSSREFMERVLAGLRAL